MSGYEEDGLHALVHAAKRLLEGEKFEEVLENIKRYKEGLTSTLLSVRNYDHASILDTYLDMANRAVELLVKSYSVANSVNRNEAETMLAGVTGLAVSADSCIFIELTTHIELQGRNRSPSSIVCLDAEKALHIVLAGLASLLASGLGEALKQSSI